MLAAASDFFAWYQIPLLIMLLFVIPAWVFGVGALMYVGGRYIAKSPRATYWRSVLVNIVSAFGGFAAYIIFIIIGTIIGSRTESPGPVLILGFIGLVAGVFVTWVIIKAMFQVSFGKAILAWLPSFGLQFVFIIILSLLVSILLPSVNRARELAKRAVCKTRLKGLGTALELYSQAEDEYPSSLMDLVENGYASKKTLNCPSDPNRENISYFYLPPLETDAGATFVMCDLKGNHKDIRNVLHKAGHVAEYSEEEFQAELAQPYNARFAAALKKAEGP